MTAILQAKQRNVNALARTRPVVNGLPEWRTLWYKRVMCELCLKHGDGQVVTLEDVGPWEQIFYGEFDGGRKKRVLVKIVGE